MRKVLFTIGIATVVVTLYVGASFVGAAKDPKNTDQCKNGGWQTFTNPTFKNQGDCIQYVNTGK